MKKTLAIILTLTVVMSLLFATTAFAEETVAPYETGVYYSIDWPYGFERFEGTAEELPLDENTEMQIKNDYIASDSVYQNLDPDELIVKYYGTMSDGSMIVHVEEIIAIHPDVMKYCVIRDYLYASGNGGGSFNLIYKDNKFISIIQAYQDGKISDEVLDEIAETLKFRKFIFPETATGENEKEESSTSAATPDTVEKSENNSNGAIPTGESGTAVFVLLLMTVIAVAGVCVAKRNWNISK